MNQPYLAFLLLLGFVAFNAALLIGLSHLLAPHKPSAIKDSPYESGMPPLGTTRERFAPPRDVSPGRCFATRLSDKAGQTVKRVIETKEVSGQSPNYLLAKFQDLVDWAVNSSRANSLWPMPFGTACCAIEFMATAASRYDFARFGMERQAFSPRQADVLICAGRLPFKLAPVIRRIYDQMPQPKWVISMGACASTGGIFDNYAMVQGIDTIVPVDVYVPGKVWSVAGLVVLAQRAGVAPGPAAASAFVIQAVSLGSGVAVVAAVTPHSAPPLRLALAGLAALATILVLVWRPTAVWLGRWVSPMAPLQPLAPSAVFAGTLLTVLSWSTYGAALWMLARGLIHDAPLPLATAIGAFTLGYILGLLALFAPGGVGVRELVLVGLLAPFLGSGGAVAVSVASRVLLTLTEAAAALLTLPLRHRPQESVH